MDKKATIILVILGIILIAIYIQQKTFQSDMESFVESYDFQELQETNILLEIPEENVQLFKINYGKPQDCASGCIYNRAIGLKHNNKIGWISIENYNSESDIPSINNIPLYDLDSTDNYLFTDEFFDKLKATDERIYRFDFLPLLAKDSDVPNETLLKIAESLSSYIQPSLAYSLLENPNVQQNKQILTIIANLPGSPGDAYSVERLNAQNLLNSLK